LTRAAEWFTRYGKWSLLFAWAPIVGDALTVIAGLARVPLWQLALLAGAGKLARYLSLAGLLAALIL
jgi:membrane protein YqaA with SNARE-associated domain